MGIPVRSRWGPPLEHYVLRYDKISIRGREEIENEIMSSALNCIKIINNISDEADEIKSESNSLPRSSSAHSWLLEADEVSQSGWPSFPTNTGNFASTLAKWLSECHLFTEEDKVNNQGTPRCDWIFGWSDPPAHGGHSKLIVAGSDALDLMDVLWDERKASLKSLSSSYTPGASIMLFLVWQYMYRKGVLLRPVSRTPLLDTFLDLTRRFTLITTPGDHDIISPIIFAALPQSGRLAESAVDVEDSRNIIEAYV
ncbi:hypothetical protein B0J17DRAFT_723380 [Rhizoctonia solani]|nr:hypothetical protein B0J17DRAFT_723380 [Rhizoctonia solani]